jgi:hypothetical protein
MQLRTTISLFFTGISLAAISVACSSSSSGGSASTSCANFAGAEIDTEIRCGAAAPISSDERANYVSRFSIICNDELSAPGTGITTAFLDGCAAALEKNPSCTGAIPECVEPAGSLAIGAACGADNQCASTRCELSSNGQNSPDGGATLTVITCGVCGATVADGAACQSGDVCVAGDECTNGTCQKETTSSGGTGAIGSSCQADADCATPNRCDITQGICAAPGTAGQACSVSSDCASGLICNVSTEQCEAPVASGGPCTGGDCASGLGCDATTKKCTTITFAAQGAACDDDAILCDRGTCNIGSSGGANAGVCPTILADGAPCGIAANTACDDFAECIDGTCQISNPASCK